MERLTKRITQYTIELSASANPIQYNGSSQRVHIKHPFWNVFDRLCKYEDAEENGMLIHLPCRVGDTAYIIDKDENGKFKVYEGFWAAISLFQGKIGGVFELHGHVHYEVYDFFYNDGRTMPHGMYVGQEKTKFGEVVFLTREEAEQALKQMGE